MDLVKVASDACNAYEKTAAAWWKKLNANQLKTVQERGLLDLTAAHEKEIVGLNRGSENIIKGIGGSLSDYSDSRIGTNFMNSPEHSEAFIKGVANKVPRFMRSATEDVLIKNKQDISDALDAYGQMAGPHTDLVGKAVHTEPIAEHVIGGVLGANKLSPKNQRYVDAIILRHEADELRYGLRDLRKKNAIRYKGVSIEGRSGLRGLGHASPLVLINESNHAAVAPDEVHQFMRRMRTFAPRRESGQVRNEIGHIRRLTEGKIQYGVYNPDATNIGRRAEERLNELNKKQYDTSQKFYDPAFRPSRSKKHDWFYYKDKALSFAQAPSTILGGLAATAAGINYAASPKEQKEVGSMKPVKNASIQESIADLQTKIAALQKQASDKERAAGGAIGAAASGIASMNPAVGLINPATVWLTSRNAANRADAAGLYYGDAKDTFAHRHPHLTAMGWTGLGGLAASAIPFLMRGKTIARGFKDALHGADPENFRNLINEIASQKSVRYSAIAGSAAGMGYATSKIVDLDPNRKRQGKG